MDWRVSLALTLVALAIGAFLGGHQVSPDLPRWGVLLYSLSAIFIVAGLLTAPWSKLRRWLNRIRMRPPFYLAPDGTRVLWEQGASWDTNDMPSTIETLLQWVKEKKRLVLAKDDYGASWGLIADKPNILPKETIHGRHTIPTYSTLRVVVFPPQTVALKEAQHKSSEADHLGVLVGSPTSIFLASSSIVIMDRNEGDIRADTYHSVFRPRFAVLDLRNEKGPDFASLVARVRYLAIDGKIMFEGDAVWSNTGGSDLLPGGSYVVPLSTGDHRLLVIGRCYEAENEWASVLAGDNLEEFGFAQGTDNKGAVTRSRGWVGLGPAAYVHVRLQGVLEKQPVDEHAWLRLSFTPSSRLEGGEAVAELLQDPPSLERRSATRTRQREQIEAWREMLAGAVAASRRGESVLFNLGHHKDWYSLQAHMETGAISKLERLEIDPLKLEKFRQAMGGTVPPAAHIIQKEISRLEREWSLL